MKLGGFLYRFLKNTAIIIFMTFYPFGTELFPFDGQIDRQTGG
jgi:hypothetical protein